MCVRTSSGHTLSKVSSFVAPGFNRTHEKTTNSRISMENSTWLLEKSMTFYTFCACWCAAIACVNSVWPRILRNTSRPLEVAGFRSSSRTLPVSAKFQSQQFAVSQFFWFASSW